MHKDLISPIVAGIIASGLFLFVFGLGLGFIFLFLPTLPLFYIGLGKKASKLPLAISVAALIILLIAGLSMSVLFIMFLALPSFYMAKYCLRSRINNGEQEWFSIGTIILNLTLYGCFIVSLITLFYAVEGDGLPQMLSQSIHDAFSDLQEDYGDVIDLLSGELSFLMFPVTLWLWGILLYIHGWLSNRILIKRGLQCRPDFAVHVFTIPSWMLSLLAISALASLIGGESMSFLGKTMVISLMLPYFFLGLALAHNACKDMPSKKIIMFFVYFMVVSQFWPALILSGIGLWHQVRSFRHVSPQK